jgi:hypothetical protein
MDGERYALFVCTTIGLAARVNKSRGIETSALENGFNF